MAGEYIPTPEHDTEKTLLMAIEICSNKHDTFLFSKLD